MLLSRGELGRQISLHVVYERDLNPPARLCQLGKFIKASTYTPIMKEYMQVPAEPKEYIPISAEMKQERAIANDTLGNELRGALKDLTRDSNAEQIDEISEPDYYNWCGEPGQESPCPVGLHPHHDAITDRLKDAEEPSLLAEEYDIPVKSLYDHLTKRHFRQDPRMEVRSRATRKLETDLIIKLGETEDEIEVLGLASRWLLQKMIEKIDEASPQEMIRFLKEFRQNALDRKKLRESEGSAPTVQVDNMTINQGDAVLSRLISALPRFCPKDRALIEEILELDVGKMEHVVEPDELMRLGQGATAKYIHDIQQTYEDEHGQYVG